MNNNSNQYNDVLNDLQDYMLNEDNMIKSLRMKLEPNPRDIKSVKPTNNTREQIFIPNQQDSLFWCLSNNRKNNYRIKILFSRHKDRDMGKLSNNQHLLACGTYIFIPWPATVVPEHYDERLLRLAQKECVEQPHRR